MNKLPVGKTVLGAYNFAFGHLGTIIGLVWVPLVLSTLLSILPTIAAHYGANTADGSTTSVGAVAVWLLIQVLSAVIAVVVTRQALGLRQGPATFYFSLGPPEFRLFGAVVAFVYAPILIYASLVLLMARVAGGAGGAPAMAAFMLLVFVGGPALFFFVVRLSFLLAPMVVSENRINLARGFSLTRGNFWRILAVILGVTVPIQFLAAAGWMVLMGGEISAIAPLNAASSPQAIEHYYAALFDIVNRHLPGLTFIDLILAPFSLGLSLSAASFAYRELAAAAPVA